MGEIEVDNCSICKKIVPVNRKYYYYDIDCECCTNKDNNHFEIVKHCNACAPVPPLKINPIVRCVPQSRERIFMIDISTIPNDLIGNLNDVEFDKLEDFMDARNIEYKCLNKEDFELIDNFKEQL